MPKSNVQPTRPEALQQLGEVQETFLQCLSALKVLSYHMLDTQIDSLGEETLALKHATQGLDQCYTRLDEILVNLANYGMPPDAQVVALREAQS